MHSFPRREINIVAWSRRQALDEDGEIKAPPAVVLIWLGEWEM